MILDRTHCIWAILSAAILIVATAIFVRTDQLEPHGVNGGSLVGLAFGIVGSAFMILAGLLAARKRVPTWRIGSAQFWLRGHIWLGVLSVPLILFHSGFGWGGLLENVLWITFVVVIVSGVYGLIVQHLLPRWITVRVPDETFGEQVPHRCRWLIVESDKLVAELSGRLDVSVDGLHDVAFDLAYGLGKLRNGKEEEDLARFLSSIYATSNGEASVAPLAAAAKATTLPLAPAGGEGPGVRGDRLLKLPPSQPVTEPAVPAPGETAPASSFSGEPAAKPLSKIEQMRAAAAAKKAAAAGIASPREGEAPAEPKSTSLVPPGGEASGVMGEQIPMSPARPANVSPAQPLSKIEQMRAAAAAKKAAAAATVPPAASPTDAAPASTEPPALPTDKPLSKIEQMRAAAAAKKSQAAGAGPAPTAPSVARRTAPEASPTSAPVLPAMSSAAANAGVTGGSSASAVASRTDPTTGKQAASASPQPIPRADEVRAFYLAEVRPFLYDRSRCRGPLGAEARSRGMFAQLRSSLPDELNPALEHLEACCDERRQFELQRKLHRWLHGWLLVHIPATLMLLALFVAHVVMALRVVPWSWPGPR